MKHYPNNPRVLSAATAIPPHCVEQREVKELTRRLFAGKFRGLECLLPVFGNSLIASRHFCRPPEWFGWEWSFPERNAQYVEHGLELSEKAARRCLARAGVSREIAARIAPRDTAAERLRCQTEVNH